MRFKYQTEKMETRLKTLSTAMVAMLLSFAMTSCDKDEKEDDLIVDDDPNCPYVDLGLPDGTLWAKCNVGATAPDEYGNYFAWGETEPREYYAYENYDYPDTFENCESYKWANYIEKSPNHVKFSYTKYVYGELCPMTFDKVGTDCFLEYDKDNMYTGDGKCELECDDDAATVNVGKQWMMPTYQQILDLSILCSIEIVLCGEKSAKTKKSYNVTGIEVVGPNGKSIFFPLNKYNANGHDSFIGHYWCKTLDTGIAGYPHYFSFGISPINGLDEYFCHTSISTTDRFYEFFVRPVYVGDK